MPGKRPGQFLAGRDAALEEVLEPVKKQLKRERKSGLARKLLHRCASGARVTGNSGLRLQVAQQRALCTCKDPISACWPDWPS
jgi:hypothetical protein